MILGTDTKKVRDHGSGKKYYAPLVRLKQPGQPVTWRALRMWGYSATDARRYAQRVMARYNRIWRAA